MAPTVLQTVVTVHHLCGTKPVWLSAGPTLVEFSFASVLSPPFHLDFYVLEQITQSLAPQAFFWIKG